MTDSNVVAALIEKRARLLGELSYHRSAVERIESAVVSLGESIKMFDPSVRLSSIKPIKRYKRCEFFRRGECTRLSLEILRESVSPMSTEAVMLQLAAAKELDIAQIDRDGLFSTVKNVLGGLAYRKVITRVTADGDDSTWSIH